jgi:2-keto-3-deoxy-L-fuconate dehydrogenase
MFSLQNKTAIITGGASGIGLAIAKLFDRQGATVHVLDLNSEQHKVDITDQGAVKKTIDTIAGKGTIDILVNNAGIAHIGTVETTTEKDIDKILAVNVKGTYNCVQACIPHMKKQGKGVILNMGSIAAMVGLTDRFAYSLSKGAIAGMTISIARDYLKDGIRCNSISPARVHTPFVDGFIAANYPGKEKEIFDKLAASQPIGRMGTPEEIAVLALYLCSDESSFVTGCDYPIDGGFVKLNT